MQCHYSVCTDPNKNMCNFNSCHWSGNNIGLGNNVCRNTDSNRNNGNWSVSPPLGILFILILHVILSCDMATAFNILTVTSVLVEPYLMENPDFRYDDEELGEYRYHVGWRYGGDDTGYGAVDIGPSVHPLNGTSGRGTDVTDYHWYTDSNNIERGQRYVGYIADLVEKLAKLVGFEYELRPTESGSFGYERSDGTWDGIVGDLLEKRAAIAAAPTYITSQRASVIDFTDPFMAVHATILVRKTLPPVSHRPGASSLEEATTSIRSVKELVAQSDVQYGTLNKGVIIRAFKKTNVSLYRQMWKRMRAFEPSTFTLTNEEGIHRARRERYAFILPHTIGEYVTRGPPPCDLTTVGKFLLHGGYSLAVAKDSSMRRPLNAALRVLAETGELDELYRKWWRDGTRRNDCSGDGSAGGGENGAQLRVRSTQQKKPWNRASENNGRRVSYVDRSEGTVVASNVGRPDCCIRTELFIQYLIAVTFSLLHFQL